MSAYLPAVVQSVIDQFERLPGVGPKSAARMAYHYLRSPNQDATKLANSLLEMEEKIVRCEKCFNVAENAICDICDSPLRDKSKICIVEEPLDVVAFEKSGIFNGYYFVLGGVISPADGIGADQLRFADLERRVRELSESADTFELIVATNPSLEGEATANYINDIFRKLIDGGKVTLTRLAMGLPTGADLEYADRLTLKRALDGRRAI